MKKIIFCMLGAAAGICLAIVVHCSFMITEMYDSSMFPAIEPGQKVLVFMLAGIEDILQQLDDNKLKLQTLSASRLGISKTVCIGEKFCDHILVILPLSGFRCISSGCIVSQFH